MSRQYFNADEAGIKALAESLANQSIRPENKFDSFDDMKRSMWRTYFLGPCRDLDNMSPMEASKTAHGRKLLESHMRHREMFEEDTSTSTSTTNPEDAEVGEVCELKGFNPPSQYIRWKLGLVNIPDGAIKFKAEEDFYNGNDSPAAIATLNAGKQADGGKDICNFCAKKGSKGVKLLICSRCKSRRYCSKECQKRDWKDHKKVCSQVANNEEGKSMFMSRDNYKKIDKMNMLELWTYWKNTLNCTEEVWRSATQKALKKGIITKKVLRADISGDRDALKKSLEALKKPSMQLHEEWSKMFFDEQVAKMGISNSMIEKYIGKIENSDFDGSLDASIYLQLPQRIDTSVTISYTGMAIDGRTGMRHFMVFACWQCDELERTQESQQTYTSMCETHSTPSLHDLKKAIHFCITSPSGVACGSDQPHRFKCMTIHNRWTPDCYKMVKDALVDAGIYPIFQTREEAERECADAGTDPDGLDFVF